MPAPNLIDVIFPQGAIHLVAGPTGAGKTRWLLETMLEAMRGGVILGNQAHPVAWAYISADRQESEVWETVDSLGILRSSIPLIPAFAPIRTLGQIFDEVERQGKLVLVWEGFGSYVGDRAGSIAVKQWLSGVTEMLWKDKRGHPRPDPMTIIGVMEQPKMKPRDQYQNARQRVSGPAAWGHSCSTIVQVEHATKNAQGPRRTIGIFPRCGPEIIANATLETGHFVIVP